MSSAANPRFANRPWPRWVPIAGWTFLGILGTTLAVFIATITFGAVHGIEFCPQTFERRSYSYFELPIVGWQVTGERHEDLTGDTEKTVTSKSYVTPPSGGKQDWHVLVGSKGTRLRQPGDAGILVKYLDATDVGSNLRWDHWTLEHDEQAKVLWPAVQQLALAQRYVFVPDLFDLAKTISDPADLKAAIDRLLASKLRKEQPKSKPATASS
jgi:hypothetical protein